MSQKQPEKIGVQKEFSITPNSTCPIGCVLGVRYKDLSSAQATSPQEQKERSSAEFEATKKTLELYALAEVNFESKV